MADPAALVDQILSGDYDGHEADIVGAVRRRVEAGAIKFGWRIAWNGLDITEDNLTVGEATIVEGITDLPIHLCPPGRDAKTIGAYVVAAMVKRDGAAQADAQDKVDSVSIKKLLQSVSDYTVTDPPKDSGGHDSP